MVKPYNASLFQMVNYIKEQFQLVVSESVINEDESIDLKNIESFENDLKLNKDRKKHIYYELKDNKNIKLNYKELYILTSTIEKIIYTEFPKLKDFNNYLREVAKICSVLNLTITWALPSGLNVNQYYEDSEAIRLKPFKYRKNTFKLLVKNNKINKPKQIRALMPNLIHSFDAASLALFVDMYFDQDENKIYNFFSIHDCFAVTANNIDRLIKYIKLVYIHIYSDNVYLKQFDTGIIESIKLHFGDQAFIIDKQQKKKFVKVNGYEFIYPNVEELISGKIEANSILESNYAIN